MHVCQTLWKTLLKSKRCQRYKAAFDVTENKLFALNVIGFGWWFHSLYLAWCQNFDASSVLLFESVSPIYFEYRNFFFQTKVISFRAVLIGFSVPFYVWCLAVSNAFQYVLSSRGGVLENVLGLEDVLEDTFWSPWPWPRRSSPWPWPRGLKSSKIGLSSAWGQHYFLEC